MTNLDSMKAFVLLARFRSFSKTARKLGLSQPALSRRIQALEKNLGAALIDRQHRPLRLTPAGRQFLGFARQTLRAYQKTRQSIMLLASTSTPHILVGASTIPGEYVVPNLIARFRKTHPSIKITVTINDSQHIIRHLQVGKIHVGFVGQQFPRKSLVYEPIFQDEIVLVVPSNHPLAEYPAIKPEQLLEQPVILRPPGSGTYAIVEERLNEKGFSLKKMKPVMSLGSSTAILEAVRKGYGLGFVSRLVLESHPSDDVRVVKIRGVNLKRPLFIVHRSDIKLLAPVRRFLKFTLEQLTPS